MQDIPKKAYKNPQFLKSPNARTLRILSEYLEPKARLNHYQVRDTIVFFGSARFLDAESAAKAMTEAATPEQKRRARQLQLGARYYEDARRLAEMLTRWAKEAANDGRHFVICSGGGGGIMEAANRGAHEAGGPSVGFNISLPREQVPNPYVNSELSFQFHYFFMRKLWFAYLAKVLIAFPGGYGTLDELMEMLTLSQTDKIRKKVLVMLYGSDYWNKVLNFDAMEEFGVIDAADRKLFRIADTPEQAFDELTPWLREHYFEVAETLP